MVPTDNEAIRAEFFSAERLELHAQSLAKAQTVSQRAHYRKPLPKRLKENASILEKALAVLASTARSKKPLTPAGEWLLDNYHIVEEQIREIKNDLPADYYNELPKLADGPLGGYPRIYGITWAIVAHTDSAFELDHLTRVVNSYQQVTPLTIGELWAIPVTLRIQGSVLMIDPCIPSSWPGFEARLAYECTIYDIAVENPNRVCGGIAELVVDGKVQDPAKPIALESNRGNCRIRVVLGTAVSVRKEELVSGAVDH